jgi:hypothetical protein
MKVIGRVLAMVVVAPFVILAVITAFPFLVIWQLCLAARSLLDFAFGGDWEWVWVWEWEV